MVYPGKTTTSKYFTCPSILNMVPSFGSLTFSNACSRVHLHTWINCCAMKLKRLTPALPPGGGTQKKKMEFYTFKQNNRERPG